VSAENDKHNSHQSPLKSNNMGVTGLLPVLKPIQDLTSLERYRGKTLAIDTYAWLHKASFCCAEDLVMERPTRSYINYFNKKIAMLRHFNITPYFVFDGDYLPSKGGVEKERETRRNEFKTLAIEAKGRGNSKLAMNNFQKACDISPEMAKSLINELKIKNIKYVVAPYEADSEMVFLEKIGLVDGIISEDSDLLIFGCQTLITKLNDRGECIEIRRDNFKNCKGSYINTFTDDQLLLMATISGCDYTKGIPGIGMQKAIQLTQSYKTYERVMMCIKVEGKRIPEGFDEEFKRAKIAFRHQVVFNPLTNAAQNLNLLTEEVSNTYTKEYIQSCTGFILDHEIHRKISNGDLDPFTKKVLISWEHKINPALMRSASVNAPLKEREHLSLLRSKTENNALLSRVPERKPELKLLTRKRKSTMQIDQFSKFIKSKQQQQQQEQQQQQQGSIDNSNTSIRLSPMSKRQRLLDNGTLSNGQPTISRFFNNHKKEIKLEPDVQKDEFPATSSDVEDITEDDIGELNLNLNLNVNPTSGSEKVQHPSSDINISEDECERDDADEMDEANMNIDLDGTIDSSMDVNMNMNMNSNSSESAGHLSNTNMSRILDSETESEVEIENEGMGEVEDILNSSDVSQSTLTMLDRGMNKSTTPPPPPTFLNKCNSSLSVNTDAGDINTDCYIEEEGEDVDKSNMLAEIYSFNRRDKDKDKDKMNDENKENVGKNAFTPARWLQRIGKPSGKPLGKGTSAQVHRPSPLQRRVPLQEIAQGGNGTSGTSGTSQAPPPKQMKDRLAAFRYSES
jgi:exonuclease 1